MARYDTIGRTYRATRVADPRIEAQIQRAFGDAGTLINVGAGTGSYEPTDRRTVAVEPSPVMLAQRPPGAAPAVRATAEHLPFPDDHFDAAAALLTIHHWTDWRAGIAELRRVARRIVILTWDPDRPPAFWLTDDYLPEALTAAHQITAPSLPELRQALGVGYFEAVPVPADCADGFFAAFWARPEAYLDPTVRDGISCFALIDQALVAERMDRLAADLSSGVWDARHGHLRDRSERDLGYRLVVGEPEPITARRARADIIDPADRHDITDRIDAAEPIESTEQNEPMDPNDSAEPTDPIDSTEPFDPIDRNESSDQSDHRELMAER